MAKSEQARRLSRLCAIMMMVIYGGTLLVYDLNNETLELVSYVILVVSNLLTGLELVYAIKNYEAGKKKKWLIHTVAAILILMAGNLWHLRWAAPGLIIEGEVLYTKCILAVFWPFGILKVVQICGYGDGKIRDRYLHVIAVSIVCTLVMFCGIWILEKVLVPPKWDDVDRTLTESVFLVCISYLVLFREYISKLRATGRKALAVCTVAAADMAALVIVIYKSPRLRVILYSLGVRLFDEEGTLKDVNWLNYRITAVKANWSGSLRPGMNQIEHYLGDGPAWFSWKRNPLLCLNAEYGKMVLLLILILFAGMILWAGHISCRNRKLEKIAWYIRVELIMAAVFSIFVDLLAVQTGLGLGNYFPLLGSGARMLPLMCIFYRLDQLEKIECAGRKDAVGTRRYKHSWKNQNAFAGILLLFSLMLWEISTTPFQMDSYAIVTERSGSLPEDAGTFEAWKEGDISYFGKRILGRQEGHGGETNGNEFFFGNHRNGKRDGYGLLKKAGGCIWMGRYDNGVMCEGIRIQKDGRWEMTNQSGNVIGDNEIPGIVHFQSGEYYGETKDGLPEGYGQYYSVGQEYFYMGGFQEGRRNGAGVCFTVTSSEDISFLEGNWKDGVFYGKGIMAVRPENGFEEGEWVHEEDTPGAAQLTDGSWVYWDNMRAGGGIHIYYQADGNWFYNNYSRLGENGC